MVLFFYSLTSPILVTSWQNISGIWPQEGLILWSSCSGKKETKDWRRGRWNLRFLPYPYQSGPPPWSPLQLPNIYHYFLWQFWKGSKVPATPLPWQMEIPGGREKTGQEYRPEINSLLEAEDLTVIVCESSLSVPQLFWGCLPWLYIQKAFALPDDSSLALPPQSSYAVIASRAIYRKQVPFLVLTKKYGAISGHCTVTPLHWSVIWRQDESCA